MDPKIKQDNQDKIELTFKVMDAMEELRDVWRRNAPLMNLDGEDKQVAAKLLEEARESIDQLEKMI